MKLTGQIVRSLSGHDAGRLYVVVGEEDGFVRVCDGRHRLMSDPKRKRRKHVEPCGGQVEESLLRRLTAGELLQDEEIKRQIRLYRGLQAKREEMYVEE